ncbi:MAG: hypothetical protein ACR2OH_08485, partial [Microthrixaceae bacterium]
MRYENEAELSAVEAAPTERRSLRLSRRQIIIVVISALVTGALAVGFALLSPPIYQTERSIIVYSGGNANENDVLSAAMEDIIGSKGMAAEVKRRGGFEESIDQIAALIGTSRRPLSPTIEIIVSSPDQAQSEAVSAQVIPALQA